MAECSWTKSLARAALLITLIASGASRPGFAQSPAGSLTGKLTDLYSKPLEGASLTLRNQATGAEVRTTTTKGGNYSFKGIEPGDYSLDALSLRLGHGSVNGIEVIAGHEERMQIAVQLTPASREEVATAAPPIAAKSTSPMGDKVVTASSPSMVEFVTRFASREIPEPIEPPFVVALEPEALRSLSFPARFSSEEERHETAVILAPRLAAAGLLGSTATEVAVQAAHEALQVGVRSPRSVIETAGDVSDGVALATALPAAQLEALPFSGRNWQNFLPDAPTADADSETGRASAERDGLGSSAMTVEGANTRLAFGGSSVGRMKGLSASLIGPGESEAAIREVQMGSGSVEAGGDHGAGVRLNVETERGRSAMHGQGFLFDRGNLMGAQNPFKQWVQQTAPATLTTIPVFTATQYTPKDQEIIWGVGVGGHIFRSRLFWFAALDGMKRDDPGVSTVKHPEDFFVQPSNDQMQVLSARLGLSSSNPVAEGLGAYSSMLQTLNGLLGPAARTSSQWTGFGRLDWALGERHKFALEGTGALWDSPGGGLTRASETYGTHSYGSSRADDQWMLGRWEAFLTPNLLAVAQGSVGRQFLTTPPENPSAFEQSLVSTAWGRLPQMTVDSRYGFTIGNPSRFGPGGYPDEHLYEGQEQLSWVRGRMLVKAGLDFRHNNDATGFLRNQTGTYNYASVENFASDALVFAAFGLNGQLNPMDQHNCDQTGKVWRDSAGTLHGLGYLPCYSSYSQTMGPANWWLSTNDWAGFVTSQWQPKKTIVASLAMRWELEQAHRHSRCSTMSICL